MGNKAWADEDEVSPLSDFIGYSISGFITIFFYIGWIPIHFGMSVRIVLGASLFGGLWLGFYMARDTWRDQKAKQKSSAKNTKR